MIDLIFESENNEDKIFTFHVTLNFILFDFLWQGYTDEPIGKILQNIANSDTVLLDRWQLKVDPNPNGQTSSDGKDSLPLNVVNNYFSLGVDAHIALEFHEARGLFIIPFSSPTTCHLYYNVFNLIS